VARIAGAAHHRNDLLGELDLEAFYAAYRPDGLGRAAYEPSMMWWR
jgi:hypothetical protein